MNVAIIKYNAGNTQSLLFALERLGVVGTVTDDPQQIRSADKIIFPGVGEASSAMIYLKQNKLDDVIRELKQPVLGICLGMQLMCQHTEEGNTEGIGIFNTSVKRFQDLKVPHMGWNTVKATADNIFPAHQQYAYFIHSYYADVCPDTAATTEYGVSFSSALVRGNYYGVQFHPEKSADAGLALLQNFIAL